MLLKLWLAKEEDNRKWTMFLDAFKKWIASPLVALNTSSDRPRKTKPLIHRNLKYEQSFEVCKVILPYTLQPRYTINSTITTLSSYI